MVRWYRDVVASFGGDPASFPVPQFSEDCLYLNIWAPAAAGSSPRPVIVYIHGGSNKGGWAYEPNYIGERLARQDVVVVSIAYRLGLLGFFSHPELTQSNLGLLDQIAALDWIQKHIATLGGDANNITVMGESAGANNITHLLVSPLAQGLFQRIIHQSAGWAVTGRGDRQTHLTAFKDLQDALLGPDGSLDKLRELEFEDLLSRAEPILQDHSFDPVVDGVSLLEPVINTLAAGRFQPVDALIGSNADEWLMYLQGTETRAAWIADNVSPAHAEAVLQTLPEDLSELEAVDRLITASAFVCPSLQLARLVNSNRGSSWFYYFARQREGEKAATMGAYHGAELPYVFDTHDQWLPTVDADRQLTAQMMGYWANFARSGDPNAEALPPWPLFDRARGEVMVLDAQLTRQAHPSATLCEALANAQPQ